MVLDTGRQIRDHTRWRIYIWFPT